MPGHNRPAPPRAAQVGITDPEIAERRGIVRLEANGLLDQANAPLRLAALQRDQTQEMHGIRMPGIDPQNLLINQRRVGKPPYMVQLLGQLEPLA